MDGALRFDDAPQPSTFSYAPVPQPLKNYFHAESTLERHRHPPARYDGTPHSSVLYEPLANGGGGGSGANDDAKETGKGDVSWKKIATIVAIVVVLAVAAALIYVFLRDDNDDDNEKSAALAGAGKRNGADIVYEPMPPAPALYSESDTVHANTQTAYAQHEQPVAGDAGVPIDDGFGDESSTTYYVPSPFHTPERSGTPLDWREPNDAAERRALERSNKPPPASWFGADAPTRGDSTAEMALDGELNNQHAIGNIYGSGRANSVLGNGAQAPFARVKDEAARHIGWAEMGECGAPEPGDAAAQMDANRIATGSARSMSELYEANLGERGQYREGSSASTLVTPDQAAQQAVGNNPDRAAQFDEGRSRAKAITAESAAAIGSIYAKKRQAAAGLSAAAAAQQRNANDTNYEYFDEYTQQPAQ